MTPAEISVEELAAWRDAGRDIALVDVREPWEAAICRLDGALNIPLNLLPSRLAEVPADRVVVVYCHHGMRSLQAVNWLQRAGRPEAVNLAGGIDAWARAIDPSMETY